LKAFPPQASFLPTAKAEERKLQILDEGLDSTERGKLFHFLMSLTQEKNYARDSRCNP
jgi:hypothetical protein